MSSKRAVERKLDDIRLRLKEAEKFFEETDCVETMRLVDKLKFAEDEIEDLL